MKHGKFSDNTKNILAMITMAEQDGQNKNKVPQKSNSMTSALAQSLRTKVAQKLN